jgi:hypothetical protein
MGAEEAAFGEGGSMRILILVVLFGCAGVDVPTQVVRQATVTNGVVVSNSPWITQKDSPSVGRFRFDITGFSAAPICVYMSSDANVYSIDIHNWSPPTSTMLDIQVLFNHQPIDSLQVDILCSGVSK